MYHVGCGEEDTNLSQFHPFGPQTRLQLPHSPVTDLPVKVQLNVGLS